MKKKTYLSMGIIVLILITLVIVVVGTLFIKDKNKEIEVAGVVNFKGKGDLWSVTYEFDSERYNRSHTNYFILVFKNPSEKPSLDDMSIRISCESSIITGNVGGMDVKEKKNKEGLYEIQFLVGTVEQT